MTLGEIEKQTKEYADAWKLWKERIEALEAEKEAAVRKHIHGIKNALNKVKEKRGTLSAAIESAPELFERPRTLVVHGIKVGLQKSKGTLECDDKNKTISLIKKHLSDQVETLINIKETLSKTAMLSLSAAELKKVGAQITDTGDKVVIKSTDSEIEKLLKVLLKEDETIEEQAEAA
ncbi:MAG: hypothetical protein HQK97_04450 [Nitrospirae bacterium]|nr:hypothetical protein [Nitrospirota bacterium]